jgi:uncharacterized membrane protein YeiH
MMKQAHFLLFFSLFYYYIGNAQVAPSFIVATDNYQLAIQSGNSNNLQNITYRIDKNQNGSFADENTMAYSTPFSLNFLRLLAGTYGIEVTANVGGATVKVVEKIDIIYPVLPSKIYAVVGKPFEVFFDNVILTDNIGQYAFVVSAPSGGVITVNKWSFTPTVAQVGVHDFQVTIRNVITNRIAATLSSKLYVAPANAGVGKEISTVLMGHSYITSYVLPPVRVASICPSVVLAAVVFLV